MATQRKRKSTLPLVLLLPLLIQCDHLADSPDGFEPRELTPLEKQVVSADNSFGFKLFKQINTGERSKNVFISPLSVSMALGMTLNGADGATRDSMQRALELSGLTMEEVNSSYRNTIWILTHLDSKVVFQIANSIWYRNGLSVEPEFIKVNGDNFDSEVNALDFANPNAAKTINAWVDRATNGRIKEIVDDPISLNVVMYLINAIYFKGTWTYEFNKDLTRDNLFTLPDGTKKPCKMMSQKGAFKYYADENVQVIDLPYGIGRFSMMVLLPKWGIDIDAFVAGVTQEQWEAVTSRFTETEITILFPKFKMEYENELKDELSSMGMGIAFTEGANFSRICRQAPLAISKVKHKTFVEVNEEGTEAAAVTSVEVIVTGGPPEVLRIDHPFIFAIREHHSGTILFIGKIVEPRL